MQLRYSHDLPPFLFGLPAIADRQVLKHSVSVRPIISRSTLLCWTLETENGWVAVQRSYAVFCGYVAIYFKLSTAAPPQPENSEARPQIQKLFQGSPANGIHFSIPSRLVFSRKTRTDGSVVPNTPEQNRWIKYVNEITVICSDPTETIKTW